MNIITLTLNPAFDVHAVAPSFREGEETIAEIIGTDCGGKGINIAKGLKLNGFDSKNIVILGKENGDSFINGLKPFGISITPIFVEGRIRENITLHPEKGEETRLSFTGFKVDDTIIEKVEEAIGKVDENTIVTLTGSNPKGVSLDKMKALVKKLQKQGAKIVIDSRSFGVSDLLECTPWLIKPNLPEICHYFGKDNMSMEEATEIAKDFNNKGIENVIVSMGSQGALYVTNGKCIFVSVPKVNAISTIGAGDSTIAGFVAGYTQGKRGEELIRLAVSYGTASCKREGTLPPLPNDIKEVFEQTKIL